MVYHQKWEAPGKCTQARKSWEICPLESLSSLTPGLLDVFDNGTALPKSCELTKSLPHNIRKWIEKIQQQIECRETKEWKKQRRLQCYRFSSKAIEQASRGFKNVRYIPPYLWRPSVLKESNSQINHMETNQQGLLSEKCLCLYLIWLLKRITLLINITNLLESSMSQ